MCVPFLRIGFIQQAEAGNGGGEGRKAGETFFQRRQLGLLLGNRGGGEGGEASERKYRCGPLQEEPHRYDYGA